MTKLNIINKDILTVDKGIIGHQVNCIGLMGAGLAKQIRDKYPIVYDNYKLYPHWELGDVQYVQINPNLFVANMAGQYGIGTDKRQTNFNALTICLQSLKYNAIVKNLPIYLPYKLASGLSGGGTITEQNETWAEVSNIILEVCPEAIICKLN